MFAHDAPLSMDEVAFVNMQGLRSFVSAPA